MSAPGAGQGVSWVDVAASAAGIYRQMETIGKEAAAGFSASFNTGVGQMGSALSSTFSRVGTQAGAAMSTSMEAAFAQMLGRLIPGADKIVHAFGASGTTAGRVMSTNFMNEFNAGLAALANVGAEQAFTGAFRGAGTRSAEFFSQAFTSRVAAGLTALGGRTTADLEASLGAAGVRGSERYAEGLAQGLSTLGGASMAEAVGRVMNGLAVHGGDIFVSGLSRKISAGMQVLSGEDIGADLVRSLGVAGELAGGVFSRGFLEKYTIGLRNLGAEVAPSLDQFTKALQAVGINLGTEAATVVGTYFQGQFRAMAEQVAPSINQIMGRLKELGAGGDEEIAIMAAGVRNSLMGMAGSARVSAESITQVMREASVATTEAWSGSAAQAIGGWLGRMEAATKVSGQTLARAAGLAGTQAATQFWADFAKMLEAEAAGGAITPEVIDRALAKVGAAEAGVQTASKLAGNMLGTLRDELNSGLAGVMGKASQMLTSLGGEAGLAGGLKMAGGIAGGVILGGVLVESALKHTFDLANKEFSAFGNLAKNAAETGMGAFKAVVEGQMPDIGRVIGVGLQGMQTAFELPLNAINEGLDATVGKIPILGGIITSVTGEIQTVLGGLFASIQEYTSIAGEFGNVLLDIGNKWQSAARDIAGQTLGLEHLQDYLGIVRDIASSGDLVHFKDVAGIVGELGQRLSGLNNGMGLTREQTTELATTLAEGNELLGDTKINVDNLTAAFNSFNVPAEQTNELLTEFINIARMTGADINELSRDLDLMSPAFQALGLDARDSALMMGLLNEEVGKPALGRFSFAFSHLTEKLHETGMSMKDLVGIVQAYGTDAEGTAAATQYVAESFGMGAKAAENFVHMIQHGIIPTHEAMVEAFNRHRGELTNPITEALEVTKQFKDTLEALSNTIQGALAPLGLGVVSKLNEVGEHLSNWLQTHQSEFIGWVGAIGEKLLEWGAKISHFLAKMLNDMSGTVETFKNIMVVTLGALNQAFISWATPWEHIIPGLKGMVDAAKDARPALVGLLDLNIGAAMRAGAAGMDALGNSLEGLEGPLAKVVSHSQDAAAFWEASRAEFGKPIRDPTGNLQFDEHGQIKREAAKLQDALGGSLKEGLTIDPAAWDQVVEQFGERGVRIAGDKATGQIKSIKANTKDELEKFTAYLNERFGPEQFAQYAAAGKVSFKVEVAPGKTAAQWLADNTGLPSELAGSVGPDGVVRPKYQFEGLPPEVAKIFGVPPGAKGGPEPGEPGQPAPKKEHGFDWKSLWPAWTPLNLFQAGGTVAGPGGTDRVPILATAGEKVMNLGASQRFGPMLDWMNAQAFQAGGDVLGAAGAYGQGIALPAGINVVTPQPMSEADTLTKAAIPDKYQGDVESAGVTMPGVSLPTNLNMKEGDRRDAEEVMTAVGIPSSLQDSDGIKIGVKLSLQPGETLPGGTGIGPAGSDTGPGPGGSVQQQVFQAMLTGGVVGFQDGGDTSGELGPLHKPMSPWAYYRQNYGTNFPFTAADPSSGNLLGGLIGMAGGGYLGAGPLTGGAKSSLSYHEPSHLAPHVGLPGTSATFWKHMREGGFPDSEWGSLSSLIQGESGWNPGAVNPSSKAYGLFQFLGHENDQYGAMGAYSSNPYQQAKAGMAYIKNRYGTPSNAYSTWLSRSPHWYQSGGAVPKGGGLLAGLLKGILGELGFQLPEGGGEGHADFWEGKQDGGHVKGVHWPGRDSVPMNVPPGTFIMNRHRSAQYRDIIDQIMGTGFAGGGMIPIITEPGERVIPPGAAPHGLLHAMNQGSLLRRQGGGQTGVLQVIYNPPGTQEYYGEAAGYGRVGPGTTQPQYYGADWAGHHGHVHTSFETGPSGEPYGMPIGTNLPATGKESAGFPQWVYQLGRQYGVYASTYPGHQEHGGKNHGLDWWPLGKADMSGLSYTPEERDRLRRFASAMTSVGSTSGAAWGHGYAGSGISASSAVSAGYGYASLRSRLRAILPPWLSNALGLQQGGTMGGNGPDDTSVTDATLPAGTRVLLVSTGGKGDPNLPRTPEPVGPFDPNAPGNAPPPWAGKAQVPAGTPGGVPTPYGTYAYPTIDNLMGMTREEAKAFVEWLHKQEKAGENLTKDTGDLAAATTDETDALGRLKQAQDGVQKVLDKNKDYLARMTPEQVEQWKQNDKEYQDALKELKDATSHETETSRKLSDVKTAQHDATVQQNQEALEQPPWEEKAKAATTPDENAAAMGSGLIKGMAQELGFGDVFGKPPWEWGIWKLFAGGASWGLNLLNAMGEAKGGGMPGAGAWPSGAGGVPGGPAAPGGAGAPAAPAAPAAGGTDYGTFDPTTGAYKMASGEMDMPEGGGYTHKHGDDWVYKKGRWYPKDKAPADGDGGGGAGAGAPGGGATADSGFPTDLKSLGGDGWATVDANGNPYPPGTRELTKDGKGTGRIFVNGKEQPRTGGPFGPAIPIPGQPAPGPPPAPKSVPGMLLPGQPAPGPPPMHGFQSGYATTDQGDQGGGFQLASAFTGLGGGGGGGQLGGFGEGMLKYLEDLTARAYRPGSAVRAPFGGIGPPPAGSVTPAMAASQPAARLPTSVGAQQANVVSITTHNNGVLRSEDEAAKFVTGAQGKRSGWTPSKAPVI